MSENISRMNDQMHNTIQYYLTKFKKISESDLFSFYFKSNPNVYSTETQIPDLYLKTIKPFDKNECFVMNINKKLNKSIFPK